MPVAQQYNFSDLFTEHPDGTLEPKALININGVVFGPGVRIGPGVAFGGVDLHRFRGSPVMAMEEGGTLVVRGFVRV